MKAKILGMKASKGTMDNGTAFDSTKIYVETRLDESKGTQKGFAVAEYNFGKSDEYDKFKHLPFPLMAEVEYEQITNGKTVKTVVSSLVPLNVPKTATA
jgi:hypothetical protein